jgi:hypothetical protein
MIGAEKRELEYRSVSLPYKPSGRSNAADKRRVIAMVEEGRSCLDLAQQLHAVEKAIGEAKKR